MAYNYNNYFNNCGVNCGDYGDHSNSGYNNHQDYTYQTYTESGYNNHSDYGYSRTSGSSKSIRILGHYIDSTGYSEYNDSYNKCSDYSKCSDYNDYCSDCSDYSNYDDYSNHTDKGYNNHSNYTTSHYANAGYNNHTNEATGHHINHFNDGKSATTMIYSISGINSSSTADWVKLGDAIGDLKKLRDAVKDIPNQKLDAKGKDFSMSLGDVANADDKFTTGQTAKADQFNETLGNIKNLWKKIWGSDGSGWPAKVKQGDKMKKDDYQKLFNKVDSLARLDQSQFYSNHYNSSKGGQNNGK